MGRYAQQRKRGGHAGAEPGLPAGPLLANFTLLTQGVQAFANWATEDFDGPDNWRTRWRVPSVSMLWTLSDSGVGTTLIGDVQASPFQALPDEQQDCEAIFCNAEGNPLSQWSAFAMISA